MREFFIKTNKEYITKLPIYQFTGRIELVDNELNYEKAISVLKKEKMLGIDTETRPSFKKGIIHKVALLQISTEDVCYLFRLNILGLKNELLEILSDPYICKIGLSLQNDFHALSMIKRVTPQNYIDIQILVKEIGLLDQSLQKIFANIFGKKISKAARLSNWECPILSNDQLLYAATDAFSCLKIYNVLKECIEKRNYKLISSP